MTRLFDDVKTLIEKRGEPVRFRYFTPTFNTGSYDDAPTLAQSGTDFWVSGFQQGIVGTKGSRDAVLLQQGLVTTDDTKLYVQGDVLTNGIFRVGIGSPTIDREYAVIEAGTDVPHLNGSAIYRKLYIRRLELGSILPGE